MNSKAGREHWPHVQSVLLAGGGIHGGAVYGASDRIGAYPADLPVRPADLGATLLHLLGVRPETELHDRAGRPFRASGGTPIRPLFAGMEEAWEIVGLDRARCDPISSPWAAPSNGGRTFGVSSTASSGSLPRIYKA